MPVRLTAAIVSVLLAGCVPPQQPAAPRAGPVLLAVVTWNMHSARGDLRRLVADVSSGRFTPRPAADLVFLLQEATDGGLHNVRVPGRGAPLSAFFVPVRRGSSGATGNAILSTAPLRDVQVVTLPRERQPRAAAVASVNVAGERLLLVSAHLENRLGWLRGLFGDGARRRQADALLAALPSAVHGIVGGDMNTMLGPGEPALGALLERFDDAPLAAPEPTFRGRLTLDHLFFDVPDGWTITRRVLEDSYGSDHQPVLGIIALGR